MKTQKAVDTHNTIIKAAELLFMEKSVSKVTISDIVKKAGVAKGTFYLYFESKDDLVWHFVEHQLGYANKWVKQITKYGYSDEELNGMIDFLTKFTKRHLKLLKMMHNVRFYSFLGHDNLQNHFESQWLKPIEMWLEKGKLQGELDIDDSRFMAYFLMDAIHNMLDKVILGDMPYSLEELGVQLKNLLKKLLK